MRTTFLNAHCVIVSLSLSLCHCHCHCHCVIVTQFAGRGNSMRTTFLNADTYSHCVSASNTHRDNFHINYASSILAGKYTILQVDAATLSQHRKTYSQKKGVGEKLLEKPRKRVVLEVF